MLVSVRTRAGIAAASLMTLGLVAGGLAPTAIGATTAARAAATTPSLKVVITKDGIKTTGPKRFRAGRFNLTLTSRVQHATAGVVKLRKGYSLKDANADINASFVPGPEGLAAIQRLVKRTTFFGGVGAARGQTVSSNLNLNKRGRYIVYDFGGPALRKIATLRVRGTVVRRPVPATSARVVAKTGARWGGSKVLPADGTIKFINNATDSPHFLILQQVAKGTTRAQVMACLMEDPTCDPSIFRAGSAESEVLEQGKSQTLTYDVPRGTYVQMCFFPDPMTQVPHAFMGMVRIVTLK